MKNNSGSSPLMRIFDKTCPSQARIIGDTQDKSLFTEKLTYIIQLALYYQSDNNIDAWESTLCYINSRSKTVLFHLVNINASLTAHFFSYTRIKCPRHA